MTKTFTLLLASILMPFSIFAQESGKGLDQYIDEAFKPVAEAIGSVIFYSVTVAENVELPIVVVYLILAAIIFTVYFKFINIRGFRIAVNTVRGIYDNIDHHDLLETDQLNIHDGDNPDTIKVEGDEGEVSHFQALTAALSGTVGLGNIAGVAVAISLGGPGATFWMIVAGLIGMSSKFVECTLGVKYRDIGVDGTVYGGPMYYLKKGLSEKGLAGLGKFFAIFFAIMCIGGSFGGGNMFQANQAAQQFNNLLGAEGGSAGVVFGVVMAAFVGMVIIGGIKRIGAVTERVVPFMVGIYVVAAVIILLVNLTHIPWAFGQIFTGAFSPEGITGGIVGVLIQGFRRAAFSNEAGIGSAAIAHSAVRTKYAASEGIVALLEPFIDTVIVCTMTALVIIVTNSDGAIMTYGMATPDGVTATSTAFETVIPWFPYILTIAVILFAFSTMLSWSYYGLQSWLFLFGRNPIADYSYKIIFCLMIIVGAASSLGSVIDFSDAMIFAMSIPNIIGLLILMPRVKEELKRYVDKIKAIER
ncbi:MAG: alanine/glycine:cation symporter family protein [Saprospiraceae bacterium]